MEYHKRKADKETESLKFWEIDKEKNEKEFEEVNGERTRYLKEGKELVVKYKEMTLSLLGFNMAFNKTTNKLLIAWKIKPELKQLLYYVPNDDLTLVKPFLDQVKKWGYDDVQNVKDNAKNIYNELTKQDIECIKKYQEEKNE